MEFDNPTEQLFFAIAFVDHAGVNGDFVTQINAAIEAGADINALNEDGATPLSEAIAGGMGSPTAVKILLELCADPNLRDQGGWSPSGICYSRSKDNVVAKNMAKIRALLEAYENIDRSDERYVDFEQAAVAGDLETIQQLMEQGLDLTSKLTDPLAIAVRESNIELAQLFIKTGCDVNRVSHDEPTL